jgi:excinuclease ABC subunit C
VSDTLTNLRKRVARASTKPGVYRWLDKDGTIIYVGKAKNLRNRLKSYVMTNAAKDQGPWKQSMYQQLADLDVTVTNSELEALMLETNLIKQHRPKYNVLMKDDKNYVYVRVSLQDPYPRLEIIRKMEKDGAKYFGPFLSPYEVRKTLDMLHDFFMWRSCKPSLDALNKETADREAVFNTGKLKPCLDSQIGQCNGLCAGIVSQKDYRRRINEVIQFFKGDYDPVITRGRELMKVVASQRKFERAASIRDTLKMVEHMKARQLVSDTSGDDVDVVGVALLSGKAHVEVMQKRAGKLIGEHHISLMGNAESTGEVLAQFLPQYYEGVVDIPESVLIGESFEDIDAFTEFLSQKRGKKVTVRVPERGIKSQLLQLAETNAHEKAKQAEASWESEQRNLDTAMSELVKHLGLEQEPTRIEGYDISHSGGTETVGSMVVFINGKPRNDQYRSFTIHTLASGVIDDYRSLKEVLSRRLRHIAGGWKMEEEQWEKNGITVSKAKKIEGPLIADILERHFGDQGLEISDQKVEEAEPEKEEIPYAQFMVARHESEVIGFVQLHEHEGKTVELRSLWIDEQFQGSKLGQFLCRAILRTVKKGKVYACVPAEYEQYYASLGFRHVLKNPKAFEQCKDRLVFVYDSVQQKADASLGSPPNLLVIDGGKGQLSTVHDVLKQFDLHIPVIGLAKREEEVFVPGKSDPIIFPKDSQAKFMLMRLRDEAHRFANYQRKKKISKHSIQSQLDTITGLGPESKQKLLATFGDVDSIRRQSDESLRTVINDEQIAALRMVL